MLEDTFSGIQTNLDEKAPLEIKEETENIIENVVQEVIYNCGECDFDTDSEESLNTHKEEHRPTRCSCAFSDEENTVLKVHNKECASLKSNVLIRNITNTKEKDMPKTTKERVSIIICGSCSKGFEDMTVMSQHMGECHGDAPKLKYTESSE